MAKMQCQREHGNDSRDATSIRPCPVDGCKFVAGACADHGRGGAGAETARILAEHAAVAHSGREVDGRDLDDTADEDGARADREALGE